MASRITAARVEETNETLKAEGMDLKVTETEIELLEALKQLAYHGGMRDYTTLAQKVIVPLREMIREVILGDLDGSFK